MLQFDQKDWLESDSQPTSQRAGQPASEPVHGQSTQTVYNLKQKCKPHEQCLIIKIKGIRVLDISELYTTL